MLKKINSHLGIKFFILLAVVIVLSVVPLSLTALHAFRGYGHQAAESNEMQIRQQAFSYLDKITRERAGRYQAFFDRVAASAGLLSSQASTIYSDLAYYSTKPLNDHHYKVLPHNGIWSNSIDDPIVSMYWGAPEMSLDINRELLALSHLSPLFERTLLENPEVLASHCITASGIGQYYTNHHESKEGVHNLPPPEVFDLRDGEPMTIFTKREDTSPGVRWTSIYKDDVIDGLMLTASAPIYDNYDTFQGITGIDVPLDTVVDDILNHGKNRSDDKILFSFLLDQNGKLIAFPEEYLPLFGLNLDRYQLTNSGDILNVSFEDSTKSDVRNLARDLAKKKHFLTNLNQETDSYYVVISRMSKLGWFVGVVVKEQDMLASVEESRIALKDTLKDIGFKGLMLSLLTVSIAIAIAFMAVKFLVMPLRNLAIATKRVAEGDLLVRSPVTTSDETGVLAASFNTMVEQLQAAQEQQKNYANSLELEVERRNVELGNKKSELEITIELLNKEVERRQIIAEALKLSQQQYFDTMEASIAGVYIIEDRIFTYVNSSFADLFKSTKKEMIGSQPLDLISDEDCPLVADNMQKRLLGTDVPPYTIKCVRKDSSSFYGEVWGQVATWQDKLVMVGTITDVSGLKLNKERLRVKDQQLQKSLNEKEVLLKEIYHRTKNNMLVIISMLDLQIQDIEDEHGKTIFLETESRIRAMALVHEKLYQSQNLSELDMGSYLREVAESLITSMALDDRIKLLSNFEPVAINIDSAVPLGLIINEIVTNSIKYAFPGNQPGSINLYIEKGKEDEILLTIGDDGIGLPEDIDIQSSTSFGIRIIITSLIEMQLRGSVTVTRDKGTQYQISFPNPRKTKRI